MKFTNIFKEYIETNNLNSLVETKQFLVENISAEFIEEARSLNSELYKDLTILDSDEAVVTAEDVMNILFYEKGKNIKKDKSEEEIKKISEKQAQLFNDILKKVKETSKNNKTTLVELTAAAVSVFRAAGQNSPTAGYNLRGVLSVLIGTKKLLTPSDGGAVNAAAVTVGAPTPTGDVTDTASDIEEPVKPTPASKFDSTLKDNEPEEKSTEGKKYLKVNKETKIEKTDFENRSIRTDANFILNTLRNDLPGTLTKADLLSRLKEEDSDINTSEMSSIIDSLIKKGKIELTDKQESSAEDSIPSQVDDEDSTSFSTDPEDFVDRQSLGATRKGFNVDFDF